MISTPRLMLDVHKMPALNFSTNEKDLIVGGNTFHIKEMLKLHGARWNPDMGAWTLSILLDSPGLRQDFEEAVVKRIAETKAADKAARAYAKSPEGVAALAAADLSFALRNGWACCKEARVVDVKRKHSSCLLHGFHVRGILYTGD